MIENPRVSFNSITFGPERSRVHSGPQLKTPETYELASVATVNREISWSWGKSNPFSPRALSRRFLCWHDTIARIFSLWVYLGRFFVWFCWKGWLMNAWNSQSIRFGLMWHMWMTRVTHVNELFHTCDRIMSHAWVMSHILMSHDIHMNRSYHVWMGHVTHMSESCHKYEWGTLRCTYDRVMSRIWRSQVTHMNVLCHTCEWLTIYIYIYTSTGVSASKFWKNLLIHFLFVAAHPAVKPGRCESRVLQCVAVCCSELQCVAVWHRVVQYGALCFGLVQRVEENWGCVSVCVRACACTRALVCVCMCVCLCVSTCVRVHVYVFACLYVRLYLFLCVLVFVCVFYTRTNTSTHKHKHKHKHKHTHARTQIDNKSTRCVIVCVQIWIYRYT